MRLKIFDDISYSNCDAGGRAWLQKKLGMVGVFVILAVFSQDLEVKWFKNAGRVLAFNTKPPAP